MTCGRLAVTSNSIDLRFLKFRRSARSSLEPAGVRTVESAGQGVEMVRRCGDAIWPALRRRRRLALPCSLLGLKTDRNGRENLSPISVTILFYQEREQDRNSRKRERDRNIRNYGNEQI